MAEGDEEGPAKKRLRAEEGPPLCAHLRASAVPLLPEALDLARDEQCVPGGSLNNLKGAEANGTRFAEAVPRELRILLADAQTSGGLLVALPPAEADALLQGLRAAGIGNGVAAVIGEVRARANGAAVIQVEA